MNGATQKIDRVYIAERSESRAQNFGYTLGILCLMLLVIFMSIFVFSNQSLRLDEAQSLWQTSHSVPRLLDIIAEDVHVPFYHILLHFWQLFFGTEVAVARFLSLLFFVMSIPAIYSLGALVYKKEVGLVAATLTAISPFLNWYGNEIRMYSLFTLLVILNTYFFVKIYRGVEGFSSVGYFVTLVLGSFTHYFFLLSILTHVIFYTVSRKRFSYFAMKTMLISYLALGLLFVPWFMYVHSQGSAENSRPSLEAPTTGSVFNTFSQFLFGFQNDTVNTVLVSLWPLGVLFALLALRKNSVVSDETILFLLSVVIPIMTIFLVSISVAPFYMTRYLVMSVPGLYLIIGWVFSTYPKPLRRLLQTGLIVVMLGTLAIQTVRADIPVKEDYREVATYLKENARAQDIIIVSAPFTIYPVEYYYPGPAEVKTLPIWNRYIQGPIPSFNPDTLPADIKALQGSHQKAWIILSYDQGYEETIRLYFDTHFHLLEKKHFSPGLSLYVYKFRYDEPNFEKIISENNDTKTPQSSN